MRKYLALIAILLLVSGCSDQSAPQQPYTAPPKETIMGTYFSPPNFPLSTIYLVEDDVDAYFDMNRQVAASTAYILRWDDPKELQEGWKEVQDRARSEGFRFQLYWDPLSQSHRAPGIPASVGGDSFSDEAVRSAFKAKALELASRKPDVLGIVPEANMLYDSDVEEFNSLVTLVKEAYDEIKAQHPDQQVTVSFLLEDLKKDAKHARAVIAAFDGAVDIYSFTTYPNAAGGTQVPDNYFAPIREYLPSEKIAISEVAWYSGIGSSDDQRDFYLRLEGMVESLRPEFVNQFWLFDMPNDMKPPFDALPQQFRTGGLVLNDGTPKPAFEALKGYKI